MRSAIFSDTRKRNAGSIGDLEELEAHVRGDDEFEWRAAERHDHAAVPAEIVERRGTEQRTAAEERDDPVLRQDKRPRVWGLRDKKQPLTKHRRERTEVSTALQ